MSLSKCPINSNYTVTYKELLCLACLDWLELPLITSTCNQLKTKKAKGANIKKIMYKWDWKYVIFASMLDFHFYWLIMNLFKVIFRGSNRHQRIIHFLFAHLTALIISAKHQNDSIVILELMIKRIVTHHLAKY